MKKQVVIIGGGETFDTYPEYLSFLASMKFDPSPIKTKNWKDNLQSDLGPNYQVFYPKMPNPLNASYDAWCLYFDKVLAHVGLNAVFVGHSLGGLFLLKRLSEIRRFSFWKPIATYLVAAPYDTLKGGFAGFTMKDTPDKRSFGELHWLHSHEDKVVTSHNTHLGSMCLGGETHWFVGRGHFIKDPHFFELVSLIRKAPWQK